MKWNSILAAVGCVLLVQCHVAAQTTLPADVPSVAIAPINVLLPNYNGVPIGETGSLEVGAFLARANDSSAAFYNPAGLTRAERVSISGSAGVFQFGSVAADGITDAAHSFQQLPSTFAFVLPNVMNNSNMAAGFAVARTTAWQQTVDYTRVRQSGNANDRISYSGAAQLDSWLASGGVGYTDGNKLRAGASIDFQFTNMERRQALANQFRTADGLNALSITSRGEAQTSHLRFTLGGQYDLTPEWTAAAVVRTRGFGIRSTGLATLEGVSATNAGTTTASFFDDGPDVSFRVPFEFKTGLAYTKPRGQAEIDLLIYAGGDPYNAYETSRPVTVLVSSGGSAPSQTDFTARPPVIDPKTVVNLALGGHFKLSPDGAWTVHGGFATDMSPVGPADTVFTKVDLHKFTGGVSGRTSHFFGSFGLQYESGSSDEILLRDLPSGQLTTQFKVKSLGFVYSLSVLF
jgi:hypothetical protein